MIASECHNAWLEDFSAGFCRSVHGAPRPPPAASTRPGECLGACAALLLTRGLRVLNCVLGVPKPKPRPLFWDTLRFFDGALKCDLFSNRKTANYISFHLWKIYRAFTEY